ncbi:MAG: hypothetical protein AAF919_10465 [Pseudomonadota bacterium]
MSNRLTNMLHRMMEGTPRWSNPARPSHASMLYEHERRKNEELRRQQYFKRYHF